MKNKLKNSYQVIVNGRVIKHGNLSLNLKQKKNNNNNCVLPLR